MNKVNKRGDMGIMMKIALLIAFTALAVGGLYFIFKKLTGEVG